MEVDDGYLVLHCYFCNPTLSYLLVIGNVFYFIISVLVTSLGIAAFNLVNHISAIIPDDLTVIPIATIVLGVVMVVLSLLACWGATRDSVCILVTYSLFLGFLAVVKMILAGNIYSFLDHAQNTTEGWINSSFHDQTLRPAFHEVEASFLCCGTVGASSYEDTTVPPSCCDTPINDQCPADDTFGGCSELIVSLIQFQGTATYWVLMVMAVIQFLWMFYITVPYTRRKPRRYANN